MTIYLSVAWWINNFYDLRVNNVVLVLLHDHLSRLLIGWLVQVHADHCYPHPGQLQANLSADSGPCPGDQGQISAQTVLGPRMKEAIGGTDVDGDHAELREEI